jgi:F0F1-type ATP synthase membrane subunit c/vacuolar-type H+-ATPase subunit K
MRKALEIGGFIAAAVLIAFGVAAIVMGVNGRSTVQDSLRAEQIVGSEDMTPALIKKEATEAGLSVSSLDIPTAALAGKSIDIGGEARAFAQYLRIHALESSGGYVYAQMGRYVAANGDPKGTSDEALAVKGDDGKPVANAARNTWVTATAFSTALNTSYMAEQLALFGIVVGIALLLSGIGFAVLAVGGTLRNPDPAFKIFGRKSPKTAGATPVPTA